ncbi:hypothetical protein T492DRAFT_839678 [Pavlovales sp. CCMP2436]|nr:hypothetical protein T492DRAFT_839678 [Pavlovales sp. CCMP2436]
MSAGLTKFADVTNFESDFPDEEEEALPKNLRGTSHSLTRMNRQAEEDVVVTPSLSRSLPAGMSNGAHVHRVTPVALRKLAHMPYAPTVLPRAEMVVGGPNLVDAHPQPEPTNRGENVRARVRAGDGGWGVGAQHSPGTRTRRIGGGDVHAAFANPY